MEPFFSIIVVCLNPGKKLGETLRSIREQRFTDYEVIIKDGGSTDGALSCVEEIFPREAEVSERSKVLLTSQKDTGIYDAMNQAVQMAGGRYVYYLNCGDLFYSESVLEEMAAFLKQQEEKGQGTGIFYGNIRERLTGQQVASNPRIDAFGCYRNVPCHQACFYSRELLLAHPFAIRYRVRADYEQFLWCFFTKEFSGKVTFAYKDLLVADYEGGGFSETKENRKLSAKEHKEITGKYMSKRQVFTYRLILCLTLSPLRTYLSQNKKTAGIYNRVKEMLYAGKGK